MQVAAKLFFAPFAFFGGYPSAAFPRRRVIVAERRSTDGFAILRRFQILLPATTGEVILLIDGHPRRWYVAIKPKTTPSRIVEGDFSDAT